MPSREHHLETVVLRRDPRRRRRLHAVAVLAVLVLPGGGWLAGYWQAGADHLRAAAEREMLAAQVSTLQQRLVTAEERLAITRLGADVDNQTLDTLRQSLREEQAMVAELREELSFYRSLMAPEEREQGLGIRSWELYPLPVAGRYHFKLVLHQQARHHAQLQGHVTVELAGLLDGDEQVLPLHGLSTDIEQQDIRLRFTYFQNIEGELELPQGFQPLRVNVAAHSSRPRQSRVERSFGWAVQEN